MRNRGMETSELDNLELSLLPADLAVTSICNSIEIVTFGQVHHLFDAL